jgi:hypothetical protein
VLVEPRLDALLQARARITELGELDEVLQLQVVDVVDQMPGVGFEPTLDRF